MKVYKWCGACIYPRSRVSSPFLFPKRCKMVEIAVFQNVLKVLIPPPISISTQVAVQGSTPTDSYTLCELKFPPQVGEKAGEKCINSLYAINQRAVVGNHSVGHGETKLNLTPETKIK